jgi:hypothetical protein
MLSQPTPLYLKQAFELLWSNHTYVDFCNHAIYPSLFSTMLLSEWIYLWKLSMTVKRLLWLSMWFLQYKLWYKCSDRNTRQSINCSLTKKKGLPSPIMIYLVLLYCDSFCSLQVKLYKGKLLSIMTCVLVSVMLLVRIFFIDTSLHKPVAVFTEFSFRLGTSKV